jgi:hypothetical protein
MLGVADELACSADKSLPTLQHDFSTSLLLMGSGAEGQLCQPSSLFTDIPSAASGGWTFGMEAATGPAFVAEQPQVTHTLCLDSSHVLLGAVQAALRADRVFEPITPHHKSASGPVVV